MIICSNCGTENLEGAYFCKNCNVALTAISVGTAQLNDGSELQAGSDELGDDNIIFLHIQDMADPVTIRLDGDIILGRTGGEERDAAHLNLDGYGAAESGVSRRHARLSRQGTKVYISDLGSTNATFINGEKLSAKQNYVLHDGDSVRLGRLDIRLFFK